MEEFSLMQLSENWARKRRERHGFATNMGTVLMGMMGMCLRLISLLQPIKMGKKCHVIETGKVFGV
jgi:hypothetical protein